MSFGFEIERKNYILFVGIVDKRMKTVRYIFDGWSNEDQKKDFFGSIEFLSQEAGAGRISPTLDDAKIACIKSVIDEDKGGTPIGSLIKVLFDSKNSDLDKIEHFFRESKVKVHRAKPFVKPVKTIWQVLRD
jgi:hypothetical protein